MVLPEKEMVVITKGTESGNFKFYKLINLTVQQCDSLFFSFTFPIVK